MVSNPVQLWRYSDKESEPDESDAPSSSQCAVQVSPFHEAYTLRMLEEEDVCKAMSGGSPGPVEAK